MSEALATAIPRAQLVWAGRSDQGLVRKRNEDSFGLFAGGAGKTRHLLVVADGVGGSAAGDVASRIAVAAIQMAFQAGGENGQPGPILEAALRGANVAVLAAAAAEPRLKTMATTCTAALLAGRRFTIAHVGDSRAYLRRRGVLRRLTCDHTVAEDFRVRGLAPAPEGAGLRQVITRCLGMSETLAVDLVTSEPLAPGDALLLCTDGLGRCVSDEEIDEFLRVAQPAAACGLLIDLVRRRGAPDNVTVAIAAIVPTRN
ncbi:serine/threonine-protein phosphatase [bacterium]|nr:serine/threonine-protein phosphatase [bacterium]